MISQIFSCEIVCVRFTNKTKHTNCFLFRPYYNSSIITKLNVIEDKIKNILVFLSNHKYRKYLIEKIYFCESNSQKKVISIRYLSDNYKIVGGVVL